jgi:hypothetical protein
MPNNSIKRIKRPAKPQVQRGIQQPRLLVRPPRSVDSDREFGIIADRVLRALVRLRR